MNGNVKLGRAAARSGEWAQYFSNASCYNMKHLKNVGPIRHCEPFLHCHSPGVATVARRLRIDVHDNDDSDNDNA